MARLPTASDFGGRPVPQSRRPTLVQSNPGVAAQADEQAALDVTKVADNLSVVGDRIQTRQEAIGRLQAERGFRTKINEEARRVLSEGNIADPQVTQQFGQFVSKLEQEQLASHGGRPESSIALANRLSQFKFSAVEKVANAGAEAQDKMVGDELQGTLNESAARVSADSSAFDRELKSFISLVDTMPINDEKKTAFKNAGIGRLVEDAVDKMVSEGSYAEAAAIVREPGIARALGEARQNRIFSNIASRPQQARIYSGPEAESLGFRPGTVVQRKGNGDFNVLMTPEKDQTVRKQKIGSLIEQGVDPERATNIVDGNIYYEVVPGLGVVREVDKVTGTAREVPLSESAKAGINRAQDESLWEISKRGEVAGLSGAAKEGIGAITGQVGLPVGEEAIRDRQRFRDAQQNLIRSLAINPRFPVAEMKRIKDETNIEPSALDSTPSLQARMRAVDESMRIRLENEIAIRDNPNMPQQTRSEAAQSAAHIAQFIKRLGVPQEQQTVIPDGLPPGSTRSGEKTKDGREVWRDTSGKPYVIE